MMSYLAPFMFIAATHKISAQATCAAHFGCKYFVRHMLGLWHNANLSYLKNWHASCVFFMRIEFRILFY